MRIYRNLAKVKGLGSLWLLMPLFFFFLTGVVHAQSVPTITAEQGDRTIQSNFSGTPVSEVCEPFLTVPAGYLYDTYVNVGKSSGTYYFEVDATYYDDLGCTGNIIGANPNPVIQAFNGSGNAAAVGPQTGDNKIVHQINISQNISLVGVRSVKMQMFIINAFPPDHFYGDANADMYFLQQVVGIASSSIAMATSSSLFTGLSASTTLAALQGQCSTSGNIFAEAFCIAGAFLFVPDPTLLNKWSQLPDSIQLRFPFSWIASIMSTWQALAASSTDNSPSLSYNLRDLGIGSTTPMGNILPNTVVFSTSTVETYLSPGILSALKTLAGVAILLVFVADVFFTSRNLLA